MGSKTAFTIDWIRATSHYAGSSVQTATEGMRAVFEKEQWIEAKFSRRPYVDGIESQFGGFYWHPDHAEFGVMFEASGQQCAAMRDQEYSPVEVIKHLREHAWSMKRIDVACDIFDSGGRPIDIYKAWHAKRLNTTAQKLTLIQNMNQGGINGETVYIGSRSSDKLLRVYDKAAERGTEADWLRCELELKHGHAAAFADAIPQAGVVGAARAYLRSMIRESAVTWFEDIFANAEIVGIQALGRKETDFERWFYKIVVPANERALRTGIPGALEILQSMVERYSKGVHG